MTESIKGRFDVRGRGAKKPPVDRHAAPPAGGGVAGGSQNVAYNNGPVVECLMAYPVFVGTKWQTDATWISLASQLQLFYTDLLSSSFYRTVLGQYGYRDGVFVSAHFDPDFSGTLDNAGVAELVGLLMAFGAIPNDAANQGNWITAHAAILHLDDTVPFYDTSLGLGGSFCSQGGGNYLYGYHYYNATLGPVPYSYGVVAGLTDACLAGDSDPIAKLPQLARITVVASHELAELISDPQPFSGWTPEIGDICEAKGLNTTFTGAHGTWTVQDIYSLFDDEQGHTYCVASSAAPQWSPPGTGATSAEAGPAHARAADTRGLLPLPPTYRDGNRIFRKPEDVHKYLRRVTGNLPHGHIHGQIPELLREAAAFLDEADDWWK